MIKVAYITADVSQYPSSSLKLLQEIRKKLHHMIDDF